LDDDEPATVAAALGALLGGDGCRQKLSECARRQAARFSWQATAAAVHEEIACTLDGGGAS
jgi:hypothetical protein